MNYMLKVNATKLGMVLFVIPVIFKMLFSSHTIFLLNLPLLLVLFAWFYAIVHKFGNEKKMVLGMSMCYVLLYSAIHRLFVVFHVIYEYNALSVLLDILYVTSACLVVYKVSKSYKQRDLRRSVIFSEFYVEFFLFLTFPLAIYKLQPKINRFIREDEERGRLMEVE